MTAARDAYIKELYLLSRVNIDNWTRFTEAYRQYALEQVEALIGAPSSEIQIAVGRARQVLVILNDMQTIDELFNKIEKKSK